MFNKFLKQNIRLFKRYVLGILMGLYATKLLLPPVLGLLNGLVSALLNLKVQLPKILAVAYMLLISTIMIIPLFAAFLAAIFQVVGTPYLIPTNFFLLLGCGIFAVPCFSKWLFDTWARFGYGQLVSGKETSLTVSLMPLVFVAPVLGVLLRAVLFALCRKRA